MVFIWTLDSHELLGPFTSRDKAHGYAKAHNRTSYQLKTDSLCQQQHIHTTLILVPTEWR